MEFREISLRHTVAAQHSISGSFELYGHLARKKRQGIEVQGSMNQPNSILALKKGAFPLVV